MERDVPSLGWVVKFVEHLRSIQSTLVHENLDKFEWVFQRLDEVRADWNQTPMQDGNDGEEKGRPFVDQLRERLSLYCDRLTCLGFNSGKYDLPLILPDLLNHLNYPEDLLPGEERQNVLVSGHLRIPVPRRDELFGTGHQLQLFPEIV